MQGLNRSTVDEPEFFATRKNQLCATLRRKEKPALSRAIDVPRPATEAALFKPSQPTHRALRFMFHRAFSYAEDTVP